MPNVSPSAGTSQMLTATSAHPRTTHFSGSERIAGASGETALDFALASREPGEPRVTATYSTLWYRWQAPGEGLFRFRLQQAHSGDPESAELMLFTGESLVDLDLVAEKELGSEISFAAQAGTVYRLRVAYSNRPGGDDGTDGTHLGVR